MQLVLPSIDKAGIKTIPETFNLNFDVPLHGGYAQSKWVAEKLLMNAKEDGYPITIYRLGRVTVSSTTGIIDIDQLPVRLIKGCIQLGKIPDSSFMVDFIPVNYIAKLIAELSSKIENTNKVYHLVQMHKMSIMAITKFLNNKGYKVQLVPYQKWQTSLAQVLEKGVENALLPLMGLFPESAEVDPWAKYDLDFVQDNVISSQKNFLINCPPCDEVLLEKYITYLESIQFL